VGLAGWQRVGYLQGSSTEEVPSLATHGGSSNPKVNSGLGLPRPGSSSKTCPGSGKGQRVGVEAKQGEERGEAILWMERRRCDQR